MSQPSYTHIVLHFIFVYSIQKRCKGNKTILMSYIYVYTKLFMFNTLSPCGMYSIYENVHVNFKHNDISTHYIE